MQLHDVSIKRDGGLMFNVWIVSSRVEEMGALMANLEKANQVSAVPSSQPLIETLRREDNHLRNQALSLIRRPCSPSSSPTTLLALALAGPWLPATLSHGAVRAAEDRRERWMLRDESDVANEEGC